jgi:hypothetical protein
MTDRTFSILVIQENPDDVFLIRHALEQQGLNCELLPAANEEEAAAAIRKLAEQRRPLDIALLELEPAREHINPVLTILEENGVPVAVIEPADGPIPANWPDRGKFRYVFQKPGHLAQYLDMARVIKMMLSAKEGASGIAVSVQQGE